MSPSLQERQWRRSLQLPDEGWGPLKPEVVNTGEERGVQYVMPGCRVKVVIFSAFCCLMLIIVEDLCHDQCEQEFEEE